MKKRYWLTASLVMSLCAAGSAQATLYGFTGFNGTAADFPIGEEQFSVDVTAVGTAGVSFLFANSGPLASSICDIYFQEYSPNAMGTMSFSYPTAGVSFAEFATPSNVPGATTIAFTATRSADSDAPVAPNGINPDEQLNISFNLINDQTFDNIIAALDDGTFRIALHAQAFPDENSAEFVTGGGGGDTPVPEPATMLLFGTGLIGFAGTFRKHLR